MTVMIAEYAIANKRKAENYPINSNCFTMCHTYRHRPLRWRIELTNVRLTRRLIAQSDSWFMISRRLISSPKCFK